MSRKDDQLRWERLNRKAAGMNAIRLFDQNNRQYESEEEAINCMQAAFGQRKADRRGNNKTCNVDAIFSGEH